MSTHRAGKSRLFLLELIFMIFFFAIASSVCIQIFAKAFTLSRDSERLTSAVNLTQSTVSILEAGGFTPDTLEKQWPQGKAENDAFTLYLDEDWLNSAEGNGTYLLNVTFTYNEIPAANISVSDITGRTPIYTLDVKHYEEALYEK